MVTQTDKRQLITEVYFLGEQKVFSGIFNKIAPTFNIFKSPKSILLKKRKAYDFAVANLFKKYGMPNDSLYEELDKMWGPIEDFSILHKILFIPEVLLGGALGLLGDRLYRLQEIFNTYINKTREYTQTIIDEKKDE